LRFGYPLDFDRHGIYRLLKSLQLTGQVPGDKRGVAETGIF
jgi:hypothetical protein